MDIERIKFEAKKELLLSVKGKLDPSRPLEAGDYVRVRLSITKLLHGDWGGVTHASIGKIVNCLPNGIDFNVDFKECGFGWKGRNYELERVTDSNEKKAELFDMMMAELPTFCKYEKNGCKEIKMKEDMVNHEQECAYGTINCPELSCKEKVTYMSLMDHLGNAHMNCQNILGEKFKLNIKIAEVEKFVPVQITAFDNTFFEVGITEKSRMNPIMLRWIYFYGDPEVAKNFFYHVRIKKENTGEELTYFGQVRSLNEKYEDIVESFEAFVVGVVKAKKFLDDNGNLTLEYKIRKMKAEAKDEDNESGISDNE